MTTTIETFIAVFLLFWAVPHPHPAFDDPYGPPETQVTVEVTGFASRESCEEYIAAAAEDSALIPVTDTEILDASCRRGF